MRVVVSELLHLTRRSENIVVDTNTDSALCISHWFGHLLPVPAVHRLVLQELQLLQMQYAKLLLMKRIFRYIGVDNFDDYEVMFLVHEAMANSSSGKLNFCVRITAGGHTVQTEYRSNSVFQENLLLAVEQGTREIKVELIDGWRRKLAQLVLDPLKDVLNEKGCAEKIFSMRVKQKSVINPQIKLTFRVQSRSDEEKGLPSGVSSAERTEDFLVSEQLRKVGWSEACSDPGEMLRYLAAACCGPVERFGVLGEKQGAYLGVRGPPKQRRFMFSLHKDEGSFHNNEKCSFTEVDVLRITGVKPDPGRAEVFFIYYVDENRVRQHLVLRRVDRTREVW
eukprot:CAMPEP_0206499202 /NCGR_PEP_ID=MMETSP0324_2-20121206/51547_1 /ASSEMBLY_ACC=CAM_ASM_000836 /TAXON_ID=2866 /ORGANISM="Crypthecodinium cohnii, Strain Seligo" /LENGTH=336 /DNA_ID=CAMNT_0053985731 /DNA_START=122 /DNA_END=1130 /DNA_ORIENTATION=+